MQMSKKKTFSHTAECHIYVNTEEKETGIWFHPDNNISTCQSKISEIFASILRIQLKPADCEKV